MLTRMAESFPMYVVTGLMFFFGFLQIALETTCANPTSKGIKLPSQFTKISFIEDYPFQE